MVIYRIHLSIYIYIYIYIIFCFHSNVSLFWLEIFVIGRYKTYFPMCIYICAVKLIVFFKLGYNDDDNVIYWTNWDDSHLLEYILLNSSRILDSFLDGPTWQTTYQPHGTSPVATSEQKRKEEQKKPITKTENWKLDIDDGWRLVKRKMHSQQKIESNQSIVNS
jgi:hypothetical protein